MVGQTLSMRPRLAFKLALIAAVAGVAMALLPVHDSVAQTPPDAEPALTPSCVFPFTPTTYEDLRDRQLFLETPDVPVVIADECVHRWTAEPKVRGQRLGIDRLALNHRIVFVEDRAQ